MVKLSEVKISIATAVAAAFGFVIALLWRDIIIGYLKLGKLWQDGGFTNLEGGIIATVVAIIITIVGILYISKWGGIGQK